LLELAIERVARRYRCVDLGVRPRTGGFIETGDFWGIKIVPLIREAVELVSYLKVQIDDEEALGFARALFERVADLEADPIDLERMEVGDFIRYPALIALADAGPTVYEAMMTIVRMQMDEHEQSRRRTATHEDVADVYVRAYDRGEPTAQAVAEAFHWQLQTARNRISAARKAGFLPETRRGRRLA
jgi:hypothetical protein